MQSRRKFILNSALVTSGLFLNASAPSKQKGFKRLICISTPFGMIPESFYPTSQGRISNISKTLRPLENFKEQLTVFSGLDHGFANGHYSGRSLFNGILLHEVNSNTEGVITLDQKVAKHHGHLTRLPYLSLKLGADANSRDGSFYTKNGIEIPSIYSPSEAYSYLFAPKSLEQRRMEIEKLKEERNRLRFIQNEFGSLKASYNKNDQNKITENQQSIESLIQKINIKEKWINQPIPEVDYDLKPEEDDFFARSNTMMDLVGLAFKTDSTRIVNVKVTGMKCKGGIEDNYHATSHHGNETGKVATLQEYEEKQLAVLAHLMNYLSKTKDSYNEGSLLDNTIILFGSGMSSPSSHSCRNLPIMLLGGGIQHKGHVKCQDKNLSNLYLSTLHYLGINAKSFGRSHGQFKEMKLV